MKIRGCNAEGEWVAVELTQQILIQGEETDRFVALQDVRARAYQCEFAAHQCWLEPAVGCAIHGGNVTISGNTQVLMPSER